MKLYFFALANASTMQSRKDPNCVDFDISVKCENYCTQLFLQCLADCDDDECYGECHRNDYVCVDSCPCHTDCIAGCEGCENPICNCKDYQDDASWQTCTQSKCPILTNCIFGCDSDDCILECVRQFKTVHEDCPCQANCPHGCPCENYDCDNNGESDDEIINGPISIQPENFITELDYSDNFEVSFEYKAHSVPSKQSWHEMIIASPTGNTSNIFFAFWFQPGWGFALHAGDELYFEREFIANKWYKIDIKQTKEENNSCKAIGYWQNEPVTECIFTCLEFESGVNLYVAGKYGNFINGQIRNFSYTKK